MWVMHRAIPHTEIYQFVKFQHFWEILELHATLKFLSADNAADVAPHKADAALSHLLVTYLQGKKSNF